MNAITVSCLVLPLIQDAAQPDTSRDAPGLLWSARAANSRQDFAEAIRLTDRIRAIERLPASVLGDTLLHAFYAHHRMEHADQAAEALEAFVAGIGSLPDSSSLPSEMRDLLLSLELPADRIEVLPAPAPSPANADGFWEMADPSEAGLDVAALDAHLDLCRESGADAALVVHGGKIVSEWYSDRYREPMATMSSVKSITALITGLLIADGKIEGVDDPVSKYLPTWEEGIRGKVTLRHLLSMTSGLARGQFEDGGVGFARNKNEYVLGVTPTIAPGTSWSYSNEGTQLLSPILENAAGVPLHEYARTRLFEPLGMRGTGMRVLDGDTLTYADANTTLRDFARLGLLIRNGGSWGGEQVVPREWAEACVTPGEKNPRYGYLWWLEDSPKSWSMRGYLDTSVWVYPELDLVVARMQRKVYLHASRTYDLDGATALLEKAVGD